MKQFLHCVKGFVDCNDCEPGCWANFEIPDNDDMIYLIEKLRVPATFIEALGDPDERPRFDHEGGWTMSILRVPRHGEAESFPYQTVPLGVLVTDNIVVTVCFFKVPIIKDFITYSQRRELTIEHPADFILHMLLSATYWFLTYLKEMSLNVTGAQHDLEHSVKNSDLISLMRLQQSLVFFNTSLRGNQVLLDRLHRVYGDNYDHDLSDDLEVEMKQADNTVNVYTEILEGTMDAYGSIISNNVNLVMKRMTCITIILMVPTLIASFYGMNVDGLSFADISGSFYIVILIALILTLATYLWLRHIKWF